MNASIESIASPESATDLRAVLVTIPPFSGLDEAALSSLLPHVSVCCLAAKETLYKQGQPADRVFFLIDGSMKLVRRSGGPREHVARLIRPAELFGETELFSSAGYPATAVALESSRLLAVDARPFAACVRANPELAWKVMERLEKRIEELQAHAESLATHTAEQKVAAYLVRRYRALPASDAVVASSCRRSDLASLLALAPETLCRVVTEFKHRGWIRSEKGCIVVIDAKGLAGVTP
jgi:CRP-like cAMP-binding protein